MSHGIKHSGSRHRKQPPRRSINIPRLFDMSRSADVERAADALAEGRFGFVHFANIIGLFCEPSASTVGDMNEFKGSERGKPVSITTSWEAVPSVVDRAAFPYQLSPEKALTIASALNRHGPAGVILPASHNVADHLSVMDKGILRSTKTVQVITAGAGSPFDDFALAVTARLPVAYFAATSANISSYSIGTPQSVHYRMKHVLKEFSDRSNAEFFVLASPDERGLGKAYRYHDARSTTIVKLSDVARDSHGAPLRDPEGKHILQITRWGSMDRQLTQRIIAQYGYGVQFPADRVRKRSYAWRRDS